VIYFGESHNTSNVNIHKFLFSNNPFDIYVNFRSKYATTFLLESSVGPEKLAEYSFIGFNPRLIFTVKNRDVKITSKDGKIVKMKNVIDPLKLLKSLIPKVSTDNHPSRLLGGAVGYISFDAFTYFENFQPQNNTSSPYPDMMFGIYDDGIVFSHKLGDSFYFTIGENRFDEVKEISENESVVGNIKTNSLQSNMSKKEFEEAVINTKKYIVDGDIFQTVISRRIDIKYEGDIAAIYRSLKEVNPSPYMYYLSNPDHEIIGSSPEMLVRISGKLIETFPIAGTRKVVDDEKQNEILSDELLKDAKERAEHIMLVDLARNDVGRIAEFGTVNVEDFMTIQKFSHVQHIVSKVTGSLKDNLDSFDALKAVFPAGTVSGAPKIRAIEIIDELENDSRGPYAGAVGYFSCTGDADFAITIRTIFALKNTLSIQTGAGIVFDSNPTREFEETKNKAAALLASIKLAETKTS